jgi:hypothetical protein
MDLWHFYEYLALAQTAFTVWMLLDAYRRNAEVFWYLIILVIQPVGAWVYFLAVFVGGLRNPLRGRGRLTWKRRPSLDELRYRAERTPTVMNHYTLAERLMEKDQYGEAISHLEKAAILDPEYCPAQYALAVCHHERGEFGQAAPPLERIIARDRQWSNYRAWRLLIRVRAGQSDKPGALSACRELTKMMPTFENKCHLAEYLLANGLRDEAGKLLEQALEDYRFLPFGDRWRDRHWAKQAHRLWQQAAK